VVHLWTLICLSLGVLGPNEREYLGDDLKEVNVFHPETAPWLSCRSAAFFPQPGHHRLETMEVDIALDLVKGRRYRMF
jgi:hypothetical protein